MIKNLFEITSKLGLAEAKVREAIDSKDEINLEIPENVIYTKPDFETFTKNLSDESFNKGAKQYLEVGVKEVKRKNNWDFTGKTVEDLVDFLSKDFTSKAKNIDETAKQALSNYEKQIDELKRINAKYENDIRDSKLTNTLVTNHKLQSVKTKIPVEKVVKLYKSEVEFEFQDSDIFVKNNKGEVLKDTRLNPISVTDHFLSWIEQNDLIEKITNPDLKPGSNGQKVFSSFSEIAEYVSQSKIIPGSPEHIKIVADSMKAGLKN